MRTSPTVRTSSAALTACGLAALTFWCFHGVSGLGFVHDFDDDLYVAGNPVVLAGLSLKGAAWAFTTFHAANWHPLTWLSHMLDAQLFGAGPAGPHLVNLLLHIANTILLFGALRRMTGDFWRSAVAAALFSAHPLRVESVAWIAERKDVLCALFWILALRAYLGYQEKRSVARYLLLLGLFGLGLLAKPMIVTLPFALLLLDYWPLGRLRAPGSAGPAPGAQSIHPPFRGSARRVLLEKAPLLALSALSSGIAYAAQAKGHAVAAGSALPVPSRVANALVACVRYIGKSAWPVDLAAIYPLPSGGHPAWAVWAAASFLAAVSVAVFRQRGRRPYIAVGWLWFLGTLVPVIGFVQVGVQSMADRYTYIPHMGLLAAAVWGAGELAAPGRLRTAFLRGVTVLVIVALGLATCRQVRYWRDGESLFRHAAAVTDGNWFALYNLGAALDAQGKAREAISPYEAALGIRPDFVEARYNLAVALGNIGRTREAVEQYRAILRISPEHPSALNNLAWLYATTDAPGLHRPEEALALAQAAVSLAPTPVTLDTLAEARFRVGDREGALSAIDAAIGLSAADRSRYETRRERFLSAPAVPAPGGRARPGPRATSGRALPPGPRPVIQEPGGN